MTLHPQPILPIPEHTTIVARAAFPKGNVYLQLRDELGTIYDDTLFTRLYPRDGQPALSPWQLALVTVLQFAENLPDRQAADAVRSRIDWKYPLGLELTDPGFNYSVLCEFRARLISGDVTNLLLDRMLDVLKEKGILKPRGHAGGTSSPHVNLSPRAAAQRALRCAARWAAAVPGDPAPTYGCDATDGAGPMVNGQSDSRRNGNPIVAGGRQ